MEEPEISDRCTVMRGGCGDQTSTMRWFGVAAVASLLLVACSGSDGSDTSAAATASIPGEQSATSEVQSADTPSATEFCTALENGLARFSSTTSDDLGDNLIALLTNYSETNRLLKSLEEVAPASLDVDMEIVVKDWDSQEQIAAQAANNPLGAFAASLVGSLLASSSYAAVDDFAIAECGQPVFGLMTTMAGSDPCGWLPGDVGQTILQRTPTERLLAELANIKDNSPSAGDSASTLIFSINDLDPAPRYGNEAIQRTQFAGADAFELLSAIDSQLMTECGYEAFGRDSVDRTFGASSQPVTGDAFVANSFAGCTRAYRPTGLIGEGAYVASNRLSGRRVAFECDTGEIAVLDLDDGWTTWFDEPNGSIAGLTGSTVVVERTIRTEASGLEPELLRKSIVMIDVESGGVAESVVFDGREDDPSQRFISFLQGSGANSLVSLSADDTITLQVLASDASVLAERVIECSGEVDRAGTTINGALLGACGQYLLVDIKNGQISDFAAEGRVRSVDYAGLTRCMTSDLVRIDDAPQVLIESPQGTTVRPFGADTELTRGYGYEGGFATAMTVVLVDNREVFAFAYDGSPKWSYPREDYNLRWSVIGDYLIAINDAQERIFIDPDSGEPLEGNSETARAYENAIGLDSGGDPTNPDLVSVDLDNGEVALGSYDHRNRYETRFYTDIGLFCKDAD